MTLQCRSYAASRLVDLIANYTRKTFSLAGGLAEFGSSIDREGMTPFLQTPEAHQALSHVQEFIRGWRTSIVGDSAPIPYADMDSDFCESNGTAGGWLHQREKCDQSGSGLHRVLPQLQGSPSTGRVGILRRRWRSKK